MPGSQTLTAELGRLDVELQKYAALGAALRLKIANLAAPPEVAASLADAIESVLPGGLDGLTPDEMTSALNGVIYELEDAKELLRDSARPPVWCIDDPAVLQSIGDRSRLFARRIVALAASHPQLAQALTGRFLDVGTGVAAIALEAAERCPVLEIVGLEIWEPSLALARANVAASPFASRIEIRKQSITELDERASYTLAFLPTSFMGRAVVETALERLSAAISPGGYLVVAAYMPPSDKTAAALMELRRVRSGGFAWTSESISAAIASRGFTAIEAQPPPGQGVGPTLFLARR